MKISLDTRLFIAFLTGVVGLAWQGIIVSFGGQAEPTLITAFSTLILATIGVGVKTNGNGNSNKRSGE